MEEDNATARMDEDEGECRISNYAKGHGKKCAQYLRETHPGVAKYSVPSHLGSRQDAIYYTAPSML